MNYTGKAPNSAKPTIEKDDTQMEHDGVIENQTGWSKDVVTNGHGELPVLSSFAYLCSIGELGVGAGSDRGPIYVHK